MGLFTRNKTKKNIEKIEFFAGNIRDFKRNIINKTGAEQQEFDFIKNIDLKELKTSFGTKKGLSYNFKNLKKVHIKILNECTLENTAIALMEILKRSNKSKFKKDILNPMIDAGFFELTIPEKPNNPKQKYRLTGKFIRRIPKN